MTADFTYNTDFAQVEVDEQQVNLTRFSLFFPEKREFFLEGRGIFDFGRGAPFGGGGGPGGGTRRPGGGGFFGGGDVPTIFFSRRIGLERGQTVPILGGGRLTGKVGKFSIGVVNMQTDDVVGANAMSTNFTVLRVKRDILRRSSIGGIYTGRSVTTAGSGSNEVYGVDGAFSFYDNVNFNGYYARTQSPGLVGDDASYQGVFTYNGDLYALQLDHLFVGDNFNPEVGFLRRDDFRRTFATGHYSPRLRSLRAVRQFIFGGSLDYIENGAGQVETRIAQARFSTELENSDRFGFDIQDNYELLARPFPIASDVTIPVGPYAFQDVFVSYSMGAQRRFSGTFSIQRADHLGELQAWRLDTRERVWTQEFVTGNGGSILTTGGGLVFLGGIGDRHFRAYDAVSGELLWQIRTNSDRTSVPSSYAVDGMQYIAFQSGAQSRPRGFDGIRAPGDGFEVPQDGVVWAFALDCQC